MDFEFKMPGKYILVGKEPVREDDLLKWGMWFETADRSVARTEFDGLNGAYVSTVFLGLDHDWTGTRPILFETMCFGGPLDGEMYRYSTWEEAEDGHQAMVDRVMKHLPVQKHDWPDDIGDFEVSGNGAEKFHEKENGQ